MDSKQQNINGRTASQDEVDAILRSLEDVVPAAVPGAARISSNASRPDTSTFRRPQDEYYSKETVEPNHITNPVALLNSFERRLVSFEGRWPDWAAIPIVDIAKAGMQYIGPEDKVQCEYCRGILYSWEDGDVPFDEHQKHFSQCPFIQQGCLEILNQEIAQRYPKQAVSCNTSNNFHEPNIGYEQYEQINKPHLFNETTQIEHPTTFEDSVSNGNVAINIVRSMGYGDEMIQKAVEILSQDVSRPEVNSANLLDVLFTLEDSMDLLDESDDEIDTLDEQLRRHANIQDSTSKWY